MQPVESKSKIPIGISTCLLGRPVRYDGGHKLDRYLVDTLGQFVEYVPVCPEVETGLGVPREAMRLAGDPSSPRLMTIQSKKDVTERMMSWADQKIQELSSLGLCGFIFKSKSPSSGMERVKVYTQNGGVVSKGVGIWAGKFMESFPLIPVEEDGRLHDPILRDNFITRIFVMKRWRGFISDHPTKKGLVEFHTRHKYLLMSHSPKDYSSLGKVISDLKAVDLHSLLHSYIQLLQHGLRLKATTKKHTNVLYHILGHFKKYLSQDEKREMTELINRYAKGQIPLIVPITLFNHYARKYDISYIKEQVYLQPHPMELMLRNHV